MADKKKPKRKSKQKPVQPAPQPEAQKPTAGKPAPTSGGTPSKPKAKGR